MDLARKVAGQELSLWGCMEVIVAEDGEGRPLAYRARLDREGRQLHESERIGDSLRTDDEIVITPHIQAG